MIEYKDCNVAAQPMEEAEVLVPEFEKPTTGPHAGPQWTKTFIRVGDLLYLRRTDYGNVDWFLVDPESDYEFDGNTDSGSAPHYKQTLSCHSETEHILEALLVQILDKEIGSTKSFDTGKKHSPDSNVEKYE